MGSLMGAYKKTSPEKKLDSAEKIMAYEEHYMKLLRRYKDEIDHIEMMMKELREERTDFYLNKLPLIRQELEKDDVSSANSAEWIEQVQENIERSFRISEQLIDHYVTKNLDEFKQALQGMR